MPVQRKVTNEIAKAMFELYKQETPIAQLQRTFGISETTIIRIKKRDRWDHRIEEIRRKAQQVADNKAAYTLATELTQINALMPLVLRSLLYQAKRARQCPECKGGGLIDGRACGSCDGKGMVRVLDSSVLDYERLVRLKKDVLEVVQPELPTEPESKEPIPDRHAELLDKIERAMTINTEELGDLLAEDIIKQRKGDGGKAK